jgi:hypothetical protein
VSRPAAPLPPPRGAAPDPRSLPRLLAAAGGPSLHAHSSRCGHTPSGGPWLVDEVGRAGLRGRGGAAFPTAVKLRTVAAGRRPIVIANSTEREPASRKDQAPLVSSPHRSHQWEKQLMRWLDMIEGRGACHHPDGTARMVRSARNTLAHDIDNHRRSRPCPTRPAGLPIPDNATSWR